VRSAIGVFARVCYLSVFDGTQGRINFRILFNALFPISGAIFGGSRGLISLGTPGSIFHDRRPGFADHEWVVS
jgi:hypothetical protein